MKLQSFFKLVEIQTKVASILPFFVGIGYTLYHFNIVKWDVLLLFFVSMLSVDMATTAINNLMDYKNDQIRSGYHFEVHNAIGAFNLSVKKVEGIVFGLLTIGVLSGLYLVYLTDIVVLLLGIIAFIVGIAYSFGPIPISRTPFGELISGVFMGGFIVFLTIYIQVSSLSLIEIEIVERFIWLKVDYVEILYIIMVAIPLVSGIANIMLANNISDVEEDIKNNRFTLVYYLGKKLSLILFTVLTFIPFVVIPLAIILKILPLICLCVFIGLPLVYKQLKAFLVLQTKKDTFVNAVKNFIIPTLLYGISLFVGALFN